MMKRITLFLLLVLNIPWLSGCSPIVQTVSTLHTVISVNSDRRSAGTIVDDKSFYLKLSGWVLNDETLKDSHLNFMVYDKSVLITGEVPTTAVQNYISKQAKLQIPAIKRIFNETAVMPNSTLTSRAKDTAITLQIEALLHKQEVVHPIHVKVLTENQTVYLMGALTKREADAATQVATQAVNVKKVVKLFDYLKNRPQAEIDREKARALEQKRLKELQQRQAEIDAKKAELRRQIRALDDSDGTDFSAQ